MVARGGEGGDPDSSGLLHLAGPEGPLQARPGAREPLDAEGHARPDLALLRDRHPGGRVALELQFQSAAGQGGRQGLQPRAAWLEFVKLEALAAKQVAAETKIQGVWSWGWPSFSVAGQRSRQGRRRMRLSLDARRRSSATARSSRASRSTPRSRRGRSRLPPACAARSARAPILKADVGRTAALTGDLGSAASALLQRAVLRAQAPVDPATVLAAERAIIRDRFGGSGSRYRAALARAAALGPRRARDRRRPAGARPRQGALPAEAAVEHEVARVPDDLRRHTRVASSPRARTRRGSAAPRAALRSRRSRPKRSSRSGRASSGRSTRSTGASGCARSGPRCRCMRSRPSSAANVARAVLGRFAKDAVYDRWLRTQQQALLANAVCARDDVPTTGDIDLTAWAPFLGA